jgi:ADP-ribose pyrophosphatase YjhB (NUDIX family)
MKPVQAPALLARGPWAEDQVRAVWREEPFAAHGRHDAAADAAIEALRERGSPSHDGVGARLAAYREVDGALELELQPLRWALRLVEGDASQSLSAICITRDSEGRWLAGRRAAWLSTWAGRWSLGAGGAVDAGESPFDTLSRELREEWAVAPVRVRGEALVRLPQQAVMFIGQAWLAPGAEVVRDKEHDEHAWWPADIDAWPPEGDDVLRRMARLVA